MRLGGPQDQPDWPVSGATLQLCRVNGFRQRLLGLHAWPSWGRRPRGLLLPACQAVHTLGLSQPVDVVFLNDKGWTMKVVHVMKPNRFAVCLQADFVLELPASFCSKPDWQHQLKVAWSSTWKIVE